MTTNNKVFINSVVRKINQISEEILQRFLSKKEFHKALQQKIVDLASSFNLRGSSEYRIQNVRADGRGGSIDVIWKANSRPFAVFEIDSFPRSKSIKKLLLVGTPFRFWVCYGSKNPTLVLYKHDSNNLIKVIKLQNIHFKRRDEKIKIKKSRAIRKSILKFSRTLE